MPSRQHQDSGWADAWARAALSSSGPMRGLLLPALKYQRSMSGSLVWSWKRESRASGRRSGGLLVTAPEGQDHATFLGLALPDDRNLLRRRRLQRLGLLERLAVRFLLLDLPAVAPARRHRVETPPQQGPRQPTDRPAQVRL